MFYVTEISQNVGRILNNNTIVKNRSFELKIKQKINFKIKKKIDNGRQFIAFRK